MLGHQSSMYHLQHEVVRAFKDIIQQHGQYMVDHLHLSNSLEVYQALKVVTFNRADEYEK